LKTKNLKNAGPRAINKYIYIMRGMKAHEKNRQAPEKRSRSRLLQRFLVLPLKFVCIFIKQ
jgi:hypothetical protein